MSKIAEAKLRLIVAGIVLVFTIVALFTINSTLAWFSENDTATASGMQVRVKSFANLIIAKTEDDITAGKLQFDVSFSEASRSDMIAVTRDDTVEDTYLKYLTNHHAVNDVTGIEKPGQTLKFEAVPSENNGQYFVDCRVFLASASSPIETSSLVAKVFAVNDLDHPYMYALSVDFYVDEVSADGYRGTTSLAEANDSSYEGIDLFDSQGGTVPLNTEDYITVIMRCYFDGALLDGDGNAYINSYTVKKDNVFIGVTFTANEITDN